MKQKPTPTPLAPTKAAIKKRTSAKSGGAQQTAAAADAAADKKAPPRGGFVCRLGRILYERKLVEGSVRQIERQILEANESIRNPNGLVDRRKIGAVIDGQLDVHFSLNELLAISTYLEQCGPAGLADFPLFERAGLLRELAQQEKVTFFLGSKNVIVPKNEKEDERGRMDMSRWDVASYRAVEDGIQRLTNRRITELMDVHLRTDADEARAALDETWTDVFSQGGSIVVIGSPRACVAAEFALAAQYDCTPFSDTGSHDPPLPFHFIWPPFPGKKPATSAFSLSLAQAKLIDAKKYKDLVSGKFGVHTPDEGILLGEDPTWEDSRTYGVITVQRRENGALWLVIAGLNGVSTYASGVLLDRLILDLPQAPAGEHSPVRSVLLEMHYKDDQPRPLHQVNMGLTWRLVGKAVDWTPDAGTLKARPSVGIRQ